MHFVGSGEDRTLVKKKKMQASLVYMLTAETLGLKLPNQKTETLNETIQDVFNVSLSTEGSDL